MPYTKKQMGLFAMVRTGKIKRKGLSKKKAGLLMKHGVKRG
jgi:hypothetical protein